MKNWTEDFFTDFYQDLFMDRTLENSGETVKKINQLFSEAGKCPAKDESILDQCCGVGDLISSWKDLGFRVQGVEFQKNYIDKGLAKYKNLTSEELIQGDACTVNLNKQFDYVVNWNSSFGFFSEEKNYNMLNNVYSHLKKDGLFLIEVFNSIFWLRNFKEKMEFVKDLNGEKVKIERNSTLDVIKMKMMQEWSFVFNSKTYSYQTQTHSYMPHEIIGLLEKIGFEIVKIMDKDGKDFNLYSERLLVIARK